MLAEKTTTTTNSKSINQYIKTISDSNKNTGYEYSRRLLFFERFINEKYNFSVDELTISKITSVDIYELLSSYVSYLVNQLGDSISNLTIKQRLVTVKNFLEYWDIEISPRKFKIKVKFPKIIRRDKQALTRADIVKILESCSNIKLKTYVLLLAATGARASEACSLRLCDLDLDNSIAHVRGEYTKMKVDRNLYLTSELVQQLKLWTTYKYRMRTIYSQKDRRNFVFTPEKHDKDLVFSSSFNFLNPWKNENSDRGIDSLYVTLVTQFNKLMDDLKIKYEDHNRHRRKITLHSFRRYVFTAISDLGYTDFADFILGHSQSTYWRKGTKEKMELFKTNIEPTLTYLDQSEIERKGADMQTRLESVEKENIQLKSKVTEALEHRKEKEDDVKTLKQQMQNILSALGNMDESSKNEWAKTMVKSGGYKKQ
jgi:integrase